MDEIIAFFVGLWDKFVSWITYGLDTIEIFLKSVILTIWDIFQDAFIWIMDQIYGLVSSVLAALPIDSSQFDMCSAGLAGEVLNILGLVGIGEAMGIIVAAIGIRLILQLIPFTRLGS